MTEYIDREGAVKEFEQCNAKKPEWTPQRVKTLLLRIPAADVAPVVRCKDCKHLRADVINGPICWNPYGLRRIFRDSYCPYGELQTNAGGGADG